MLSPPDGKKLACATLLFTLGAALAGGRAKAETAPSSPAPSSPAPSSPAPSSPAPSSPHPRLFIGPGAGPTLSAMKKRAGDPRSRAAAVVNECRKIAATPHAALRSGYQGLDWAEAAMTCALSYQLTGDAEAARIGVKLWRAMLEDVDTVGDRRACVAGAPPPQAIASVRRDTGYAIRFIGPSSALAYDWLHDAPGVTEALRRQSRDCFRAWIDWYTKDGYLHDQPGANYHAGFVAAKALIAIALAGEDGAVGDRYWREVVGDVFARQIVGNGLAASTGGEPAGVTGALVGGDWPEGWQYGPLSVIEYALAARALAENGAADVVAPLGRWADEVTLRFLHGLSPGRSFGYVGGNLDEEAHLFPAANPASLLATILGPGGDRAAGWAAQLRRTTFKTQNDTFVREALAEARAVAPADFLATRPSRWYVARGTRTVYARSAWDPGAFWAVFQSAPRLVADHQHPDAGNFVFSRGDDAIIADPSPYGTRSTLTANAPTVDAGSVPGNYRPSQTPSSHADLSLARGTASGVVAARGELADAFVFVEIPSDIPFARRDWVFLPEGEVAIIDRVRSDDPAKRTHLRFRSGATGLALGGPPEARAATGTVGGSQVVIHAVALSSGAPTVADVPGKGNCEAPAFGACASARLPVGEYRVDLAGPVATAVHVIDALARGEAPAAVASLARVGAGNVVGADVTRGGRRTFVVASSARDGDPGDILAYATPGDRAARHVVFDAPLGPGGRASVAATADGDRCRVAITAATAAGGAGVFQGAPLVFELSPARAGCRAVEDPAAAPGAVPPITGAPLMKAAATARPGLLQKVLPRAAPLRRLAGRLRHSQKVRRLVPVALLAFALFVVLLAMAWGRRRRARGARAAALAASGPAPRS